MADGAVTLSESETGEVRKISWDWLSATTETVGAVAECTTSKRYSGFVMRAVFIPDSGDTAPTAAHDITVKDEDGVDVLNGNGADLSGTATVQKMFSDGLAVVKSTKLALAVAAAGENKGGIVHIYVLRSD